MLNLKFEQAWEKTISEQDRLYIERFVTNHPIHGYSVRFSPLWRAMNHKGDLLLTAIIHNPTEGGIPINNMQFQYLSNGESLAEHTFTITSLIIEPKTCMPWTFIFPAGSFNKERVKGNRNRMEIETDELRLIG